MTTFHIKRIYEPASKDDGYRVLVDRIWPRGVSKNKAKLDAWAKELAPSTELRKWFHHDPDKYAEFKKRYRAELAHNDTLSDYKKAWHDYATVTLVYGAHDETHNQAAVLKEYLAS